MTALYRYFPPFLSGILFTLSFPDLSIWWLAFFAFVPLLVFIASAEKKERFFAGMVTGITHYVTLLYWLVPTLRVYGDFHFPVAVSILVFLCLYLSLYIAAFCLVCGAFKWDSPFMPLQTAALFVTLEYLRSFVFSGFPWGVAGYSQYLNTPLIQIADTTGVFGISFVIMVFNSCAAMVWVNMRPRFPGSVSVTPTLCIPVFYTVLMISAVLFYGHVKLKPAAISQVGNKHANIAVIQGNIAQHIKWEDEFIEATLKKYTTLSMKVSEKNPDLIVWPETALPFFYGSDISLSNRVDACIRKAKTQFLIGSPAFERNDNTVKYFNRAYMINRFSIVTGRYDKIHLVPFGEYIPFGSYFPFLGKLTQNAGDFSKGESGSRPLQFKKGEAGVLICFEIIFPYLSRRVVNNGATVLITITNDAWFGRTSAPAQHFSMAVLRAVENRRAVVRAANTGISGFISPDGRIRDISPLFKEDILLDSVPMVRTKSVYTHWGDIFSILCTVAMGLVFVVRIGRKRIKTDCA